MKVYKNIRKTKPKSQSMLALEILLFKVCDLHQLYYFNLDLCLMLLCVASGNLRSPQIFNMNYRIYIKNVQVFLLIFNNLIQYVPINIHAKICEQNHKQ